MAGVLFFGLLNYTHVRDFALSIKRNLPYELYGINNNPNYNSENESVNSEIYTDYYNVQRVNNVFDVIVKFFSALSCICKITKEHQIHLVQFHYISYFVLPLIIYCKIKKIRTSSFVWGSDLLRAGSIKKIYLHIVFDLSDSIVCDSSTLRDKIKEDFSDNAAKVQAVMFGSKMIDQLNDFSDNKTECRRKLNLPSDKIIVMCGYNGYEEQNHIRIINSLIPYKDQLFLILPMTYGSSVNYKQIVANKLEDSKINYCLLESFLDNEIWASYIIASDVFVHMQVSDAFSSSLAEHLFVGNIVINANWLHYSDLKDVDAFYLSASFQTLPAMVGDVISHKNIIFTKCKKNRNKIYKLKSLDYCVKTYWANYFQAQVNNIV